MAVKDCIHLRNKRLFFTVLQRILFFFTNKTSAADFLLVQSNCAVQPWKRNTVWSWILQNVWTDLLKKKTEILINSGRAGIFTLVAKSEEMSGQAQHDIFDYLLQGWDMFQPRFLLNLSQQQMENLWNLLLRSPSAGFALLNPSSK